MRKFNLDEEKNENRKIVCRGIIISSDNVEDFRTKSDLGFNWIFKAIIILNSVSRVTFKLHKTFYIGM